MGAVRHLSLVPDPEPGRAYDALLDLLADDEEATARFERACRQYVLIPDGEVLAMRSALVRRGEHYRYEHIEAALYALALDELPESWAAGRERLRRRVRDRGAGGGAPTAAMAVEDLVATETVWLREMWLLAESPPSYDRLREVSAKVWRELRRRGVRFEPQDFTDEVHAVLCTVFPGSPGVAWDPAWADTLMLRAIAHVGERMRPEEYASDLPRMAYAEAEIGAAYVAEDRRRYRRTLREWMAAARDAADSDS